MDMGIGSAGFEGPKLSVVIPCYNEQGSIAPLLERLIPVCQKSFGASFEILLIDDGSKDATWQEICENSDDFEYIIGVKLARNAGHQLALSAGLQQARGEYIFILDADLQDPPELLPVMFTQINNGNDVVYGQRRERAGETWFKRKSASWFYRLLSRLSNIDIPKDTGDFRLITRRVLNEFNAMPECHRFVRGMVSWIGFNQAAILYDREERFNGETHYPLKKMLSFAVDAITSFSVVPLRMASLIGACVSALSVVSMIWVGISYLLGETIQGWASLATIILFIGGAQLLFLGVIGEYVGRIYVESKRRPLYILDMIHRGKRGANPVAELQEIIKAAQNG
jgi:polyisoprenyl-phosphate glycosyltransferase